LDSKLPARVNQHPCRSLHHFEQGLFKAKRGPEKVGFEFGDPDVVQRVGCLKLRCRNIDTCETMFVFACVEVIFCLFKLNVIVLRFVSVNPTLSCFGEGRGWTIFWNNLNGFYKFYHSTRVGAGFNQGKIARA